MDMFDEGHYIIAEDPKGLKGPYEGYVQKVDLHGTKLIHPELGEMTIPNKVMVDLVVLNLDRHPFHFHKVPLKSIPDVQEVLGATVNFLAKLTSKDETWYNRIFKTATVDGVANDTVPVRVIHEAEGPSLYLPVRKHRNAKAAVDALITQKIIEVRT